MERIISRADLAGSERSLSASPDPEVLARLKGLDELEYAAPDAQSLDPIQAPEPQEDDEVEFQLFAAPKNGGDATLHKIRLRSPSRDPDKVGFIQPHRNQNYYFSTALTTEEKNKLDAAALTGDEVLARATVAWPGSAYSWKVLRLPRSGHAKTPLPPATSRFSRLVDDEQEKKRTRPGKKYRIKLRTKLAATQAQRDARKAAEEVKDAAEREKRTRRNREKKVKKKAREKAKKDGEAPEDGDG